MKLKEELIQGLKVISENDRDLRSLVIWCNPNFIKGSDRDLTPKILEILEEIATKKTKRINLQVNRPSKKFVLYTLKSNF